MVGYIFICLYVKISIMNYLCPTATLLSTSLLFAHDNNKLCFCLFHNRCIDLIDGYRCECFHGYHGVNCSQEVNECNSAPCQNEATCVDEVNGYACQCLPGFTGRSFVIYWIKVLLIS